MLTSVSEIMGKAHEKGHAVFCFESFNYEGISLALEAADEVSQPVVVMLPHDMTFYMSPEVYAKIASLLAEKSKSPVSFLYDRCQTTDQVKTAFACGFPSVTYAPDADNMDAYFKSMDEAVRIAQEYQGEIHAEGRSLSREKIIELSEKIAVKSVIVPAMVKLDGYDSRFSHTRHWYRQNRASLDFKLLKDLQGELKIPMVLNGCHNVSTQDFQKAVKLGVGMIDDGCPYDTAFYDQILQRMLAEDSGESYFSSIYTSREAMKSYVKNRILSV